jgi:DNA mismatch repair ATPase MutS
MFQQFNLIQPLKWSYTKLQQIGFVMKQFYDLYTEPLWAESLEYSFACVGYLDNLEQLQHNLIPLNMHKASFASPTSFVGLFNPHLPTGVRNNVTLKRPMVITGPNASGKTTVIKSVFINLLLSQQVGYGCFEKANVHVYKYLHCYLNIPDTSGRDSLFQAEARRCKEIVDCIEENSEDRHFCLFDELFSGTNPTEAIASAYAFMSYLSTYKTVNVMLTTHFVELCEKLNKKVDNWRMKTSVGKKNLLYTYQLEEGISTVKGGIQVLQEMQYPTAILQEMEFVDTQEDISSPKE